jgi:hypothetical protein
VNLAVVYLSGRNVESMGYRRVSEEGKSSALYGPVGHAGHGVLTKLSRLELSRKIVPYEHSRGWSDAIE